MHTMNDTIAFEPVYEERRTAAISSNGICRYHLGRRWAEGGATLLFVMLNPSTADAEFDDPTTLKCKRFAKILGFSAIEIVNLYAWRATDPADLKAAGYPVGDQNNTWIASTSRRIAKYGGQVCVAWGVQPLSTAHRVEEVLDLIREAGATPMCLKLTKDGHPAHPLYLSSMCKLFEYEPTGSVEPQAVDRRARIASILAIAQARNGASA